MSEAQPIKSDEREAVKRKVAKLLNMTLDKGASESEALMAANKAGELMAHWDIEASELQIKSTKAIKGVVPCRTYMNRMTGEGFVVDLAKFCDCMIWHSGVAETRKYNFFGMPQDVEMACYLYELLADTCLRELELYKETEHYAQQLARGMSGRITRSDFLRGMEERLCARLIDMRKAKAETIKAATGTALVIVKEVQIKEDFEALGMKLRSKNRRMRGGRNYNAKEAGWNAGGNVNINTGIGQKSQGKLS